ncbi:uncharacterized protein [Notamacropus eugenii]|uniref:uncharacterized protein n=1 Tax=Notamacropus eugenii TaxID=9315 RepID=UPI003B67EAED
MVRRKAGENLGPVPALGDGCSMGRGIGGGGWLEQGRGLGRWSRRSGPAGCCCSSRRRLRCRRWPLAAGVSGSSPAAEQRQQQPLRGASERARAAGGGGRAARAPQSQPRGAAPALQPSPPPAQAESSRPSPSPGAGASSLELPASSAAAPAGSWARPWESFPCGGGGCGGGGGSSSGFRGSRGRCGCSRLPQRAARRLRSCPVPALRAAPGVAYPTAAAAAAAVGSRDYRGARDKEGIKDLRRSQQSSAPGAKEVSSGISLELNKNMAGDAAAARWAQWGF